MKRFFIKGLIFALPLVLLLSFVEYRLSKIPNGYNTKKTFLERRLSQYEVLITGSSHAFTGINPAALDCPAYNIAYLGQSLYYDSQLVLKYLDEMPSLKLLVVPVSYQSLEYRLSNNRNDSWRADFYDKYYGIPAEGGRAAWFNPVDYSFIALYGIDESRLYVRQGFRPRIEGKIDENGWGNIGTSSKITDEIVSDRIAHHHSIMRPEVIEANLKSMENMFEKVKAKNVSIVIMTAPISQAYADNISPERYARMQDGIRHLSSKYGVEYFNYLFDRRFTTEDFRDSDHLNARGAEKLSRIIKDEFVTKYIKREQASRQKPARVDH
ncbi:MAG: hypothetical protein WCF57_10225 [Pyrinomonadaceae bacterium]